MTAAIVDFTARGAARAVASAIESYAAERRVVSALVVPWESDSVTLRMAVTSTKSDGWAIEHTNLGTVSLTDLGGERTRVVVVAPDANDANDGNGAGDATGDDVPGQAHMRDEQRAMLIAFARQIEKKFATAPTGPTAPVEHVPGGHP